MHKSEFLTAGKNLNPGSRVLIMVHGRGGSPEDILSLSQYLHVPDYGLIAPRATNNTWYPFSFLSPVAQNEPWLSSALQILKNKIVELNQLGITSEKIFFLGFSQGACLALEFVTRNAARYGGVIAFTGGLIGDNINTDNYSGDFQETPVFIGSSDPDPHVPPSRVTETAKQLEKMNAKVSMKIYKGMGHTINEDEIAAANQILV